MRTINSAPQRGRKQTQRERLLAGMTDVVAREGYADTTVGNVVACAGVSKPTFYEYFTDKTDCFVAVLAGTQELLVRQIRRTVKDRPFEQATYAALASLTEFADAQPGLARIVMNEPMAGGARALDVRDQGLSAIETIIEAQYRRVDPDIAVPDISARTLIGGMYRLFASHLRSDNRGVGVLLEGLLVWSKYYEVPLREHRWRSLDPVAPLALSPVIGTPLQPLHPLGPGRVRLPRDEVTEHQRQRILLAAACLAEEKGYLAVTVMDISRRAHVDTRTFYSLFADKQQAFRALHELLFRQIIAVTAAGFLAGDTWPERVWEAGRAFAQYMEQNPTLAYASLVDSHAGDADTVKRVDELVAGFTIFLQEGYQYKTQDPPPSSIAREAIASTMFEVDYRQVREARVQELSRLVPHMAFISLAPFLGPCETNAFINAQLVAELTPRDA